MMKKAFVAMYTLLFLTDYGWNDAYVGILKATALSTLTPQAKAKTTLLDLLHAVPAFQIHIGAWHLLTSLPYCPPDSVFVCVVDPNVGDTEQGVLLAYRASYNQWFIAPDNGLLAPLLQADASILVWRFSSQSLKPFGWHYATETLETLAGSTFAGRDLYAPLGAMLLNKQVQGVNLVAWVTQLAQQGQAESQVWQPCTGWVAPSLVNETTFEGNVLTLDGFGNAILTIPHFWLDLTIAQVGLSIGNQPPVELPLVAHYGALPLGALGVVRGSYGYLEVACNQGSAEKKLGIEPKMVVRLIATSV
jgi:S-adenosyl-L-methionine hydrolase (adenosine-forming)